MNLPNKLTILRMLLVPVFMFLLLSEGITMHFVALVVFCIASLTDALDGHIARKHNLITNFGKFMDPLADKVLTTAAFLIFMQQGLIGSVAIMIILVREFVVSGIRLVAAGNGNVIAASFWGKFKTVSQMVAIILTILLMNISAIPVGISTAISITLIWISIAFTVISGLEYLIKNIKIFEGEI